MRQSKSIKKRIAASVATLREKTIMSIRGAVTDPSRDSWWRQRTSCRDKCIDWRDVKKCGCAISQKCAQCSVSNKVGFTKLAGS